MHIVWEAEKQALHDNLRMNKTFVLSFQYAQKAYSCLVLNDYA
jgi:hypothetical protein